MSIESRKREGLVGINNTVKLFREKFFGNLRLTILDLEISLGMLMLLVGATLFSIRLYLIGLVLVSWLVAKLYISWQHRRTEPAVQAAMQVLTGLPQSYQDHIEALATEVLACEARLQSARNHGLDSVITLQTMAFNGALHDFIRTIECHICQLPRVIVVTFYGSHSDS